MILRFRPEAEAEIEAARVYLNTQSFGLGQRFINEMAASFDRIAAMPFSYPLLQNVPGARPYRRALAHDFPYAIIFTLIGEEIIIAAAAHTSRAPDYWFGRIS